jgi:hypothetical protein
MFPGAESYDVDTEPHFYLAEVGGWKYLAP